MLGIKAENYDVIPGIVDSRRWAPADISQKVYELIIEILWKLFLFLIFIFKIQSRHKCAHGTTAELWCNVHNCDLIGS